MTNTEHRNAQLYFALKNAKSGRVTEIGRVTVTWKAFSMHLHCAMKERTDLQGKA